MPSTARPPAGQPRSATGPAAATRAAGSESQVVVGIDPGLTRCGWGVVHGTRSRLHHVAHGTLRTSTSETLADRLGAIFAGLEQVLAEHDATQVGVERVLFSRNVRTAMATGQAAGVALLAASRAGLPVVEITPTSVKATVAGHGDADKDAVARMVTAQLGLAAPPRPADAADALAVAMAVILQSGPMAAPRPRNSGAGNVDGGGWEAHLASRGLQVVGGTVAPGSAVAGSTQGALTGAQSEGPGESQNGSTTGPTARRRS